MNEASALAVKVVVAEMREALFFASLAAFHVEGFELSINDIFFCCYFETEQYLFTVCTLRWPESCMM